MHLVDVCDLAYGEARRDDPPLALVTDDWVLVTHYSIPSPDRFVRRMTTFVRIDESWRRDDERHDNVLIDTSRLPALFDRHGVEAAIGPSFGAEELPAGLIALTGRRAG